jgi:hypothetical protein
MSADTITREKIERAKLRVEAAAGVDPQRRDELLDLLDHAEHISNGGGKSVEDIAKAVSALARAYVSDSLELARRCAACAPLQKGWMGFVVQVKWPAAMLGSVALFSPQFPLVISVAEKFLKLTP